MEYIISSDRTLNKKVSVMYCFRDKVLLFIGVPAKNLQIV